MTDDSLADKPLGPRCCIPEDTLISAGIATDVRPSFGSYSAFFYDNRLNDYESKCQFTCHPCESLCDTCITVSRLITRRLGHTYTRKCLSLDQLRPYCVGLRCLFVILHISAHKACYDVMDLFLSRLLQHDSNMDRMNKVMDALAHATPFGLEGCSRFLELHKANRAQAAKGIMLSWLVDPDTFVLNSRLYQAILDFLNVNTPLQRSACLTAASNYLKHQSAIIIREVKVLETLPTDHVSAAQIAEVESFSASTDSVLSLATESRSILSTHQESLNQNAVLTISLQDMPPLRRAAMGVTEDGLSLRISLTLDDSDCPVSCSVYLDDGPTENSYTYNHLKVHSSDFRGEKKDLNDQQKGELQQFANVDSRPKKIRAARKIRLSSFLPRNRTATPPWTYAVKTTLTSVSHPITTFRTPRITSFTSTPSKAYYDRASPLTYQVARMLSNLLEKPSITSVQDIYTSVITFLHYSPTRCCPACQTPHIISPHRLTPCSQSKCFSWWSAISPEVTIPELRSDPVVVDLLLNAVYATAITAVGSTTKTSRAELALLQGCPIREPADIIRTIDSLPPLSLLSATNPLLVNTSSSSGGVHALTASEKKAWQFLYWLVTSHRGLLVSCSPTHNSAYHIPAFSTTDAAAAHDPLTPPKPARQFLLAQPSPRLSAAFASNVPFRGPDLHAPVLYHGTSLRRLFGILRIGVANMSKTPLGVNGASWGKGIYASTSPSTAGSYAAGHSGVVPHNVAGAADIACRKVPWRNSVFGEGGGSTTLAGAGNMKILLGLECANEHVRPKRIGGDIYVVREPGCVVLRYIFLIGASQTYPVGRDVELQMRAAFERRKLEEAGGK